MLAKARTFFSRHPVLRDAMIWAVPAILFGVVLRLLLLSYSPYAYWGSDSRSYYSFADKLLNHGYVSLDEKRRYFYPLFAGAVSILPGPALKWLAWIQHALGVLTLLPLAYIVRKTLTHWRAWIVPITVIYAGMPVILWYEHELLGENIFFASLMWAFAGWTAWVSEERLERFRRLFWWFFVPFALFLITKPSGRFVWPGVCLGLLLTGVWRRLDRRQWIALGVLVIVTLTVGSKKQGAWLLYVATFPLTQLDTPAHADYKAEIRDMVEPLRNDLGSYYLHDGGPFSFLESPDRVPGKPLWNALAKDEKRKARLYMDLALEAVKAHPGLFVYLGLQRVIASANPSEFKEDRFTSGYYVERFEHFYAELPTVKRTPMNLLFAMRGKDPLPSYEEFAKRLSPAPDSWRERVVTGWVQAYEYASDLVRLPLKTVGNIANARPTILGCWLLLGCILSLLPGYRRTLGVWMLVAAGYLFGVFMVSQPNPRYFAPAWPVLVVLLAVPADAILRALTARYRSPR